MGLGLTAQVSDHERERGETDVCDEGDQEDDAGAIRGGCQNQRERERIESDIVRGVE